MYNYEINAEKLDQIKQNIVSLSPIAARSSEGKVMK